MHSETETASEATLFFQLVWQPDKFMCAGCFQVSQIQVDALWCVKLSAEGFCYILRSCQVQSAMAHICCGTSVILKGEVQHVTTIEDSSTQLDCLLTQLPLLLHHVLWPILIVLQSFILRSRKLHWDPSWCTAS